MIINNFQSKFQHLSEQSIKLLWQKGRSNGYPQRFRVSIRSSDLVIDFKKEYLTFGDSLVVRNLTQNIEYLITIVAENDKGKSTPYDKVYSFSTPTSLSTAGSKAAQISLVSISILILIIIVVLLFINKKKGIIYNPKSESFLIRKIWMKK